MGSPATKLAAETELAETVIEPTADASRSVDRTLPGVGASIPSRQLLIWARSQQLAPERVAPKGI